MSASNKTPHRKAFTLVEVMVSLVVIGVVLIAARITLETLGDAGRRLATSARETDRAANADGVLRILFRNIEIGSEQDHPFGGNATAAHFTSWCQASGGWMERCDVVVAFELQGDTNVLALHLAPVEPHGRIGPTSVRMASRFRTGSLRYLNDARGGGLWFEQWGDGPVAPLAVGVVIDGDTAILRIGARG